MKVFSALLTLLFIACIPAALLLPTPWRGVLILVGLAGMGIMSMAMLHSAIDPEEPENNPFKLPDLLEKKEDR